MSNRRRHAGNRDDPEPAKTLGVFGLSLYTTEKDLEKEFSKYGPIEKVQVVLDGHSGRSRGFAFINFENIDDAQEVTAFLSPSNGHIFILLDDTHLALYFTVVSALSSWVCPDLSIYGLYYTY